MAYDAGVERERLAKLFFELVNGEPTLDRATALKQFAQGVSRQADETRIPLERILNDLEADAIDMIFDPEDMDPDAEPPRASERFLEAKPAGLLKQLEVALDMDASLATISFMPADIRTHYDGKAEMETLESIPDSKLYDAAVRYLAENDEPWDFFDGAVSAIVEDANKS